MISEQEVIDTLDDPWKLYSFLNRRDPAGLASQMDSETPWLHENIVACYLRSVFGSSEVGVDYSSIFLHDEEGHLLVIRFKEHEQELAWIEWYLTMLDGIAAGKDHVWVTREQALAFLTIAKDMHSLWLSQ